jgi:glycerol-3-phosphate acyltransferase PlsX
LAQPLRIAIDAMGGDFGPPVTVPAAVAALEKYPQLEVLLFGRESDLTPIVDECSGQARQRLTLCHCDQVVSMGDKPTQALRGKKNSSMRLAIDSLKAHAVDACVSAGNTGALMAIGCYVLKTSPGIDRPAICVSMPTGSGQTYLLDLGANVDNCSEHLHQFALMGSVLSEVLDGVAEPRVALLNIGHEEIKGNEQVKFAAQLIGQDPRLNYTGYIEADRLLDGDADVIVCDGFVGNVALKASEGTARLIALKARHVFNSNLYTRALGWLVKPLLQRVQQQINPESYNGAYFLGLQGVLVKSHGAASAAGFQHAIECAILQIENRMVEHLDHALETLAQ